MVSTRSSWRCSVSLAWLRCFTHAPASAQPTKATPSSVQNNRRCAGLQSSLPRKLQCGLVTRSTSIRPCSFPRVRSDVRVPDAAAARSGHPRSLHPHAVRSIPAAAPSSSSPPDILRPHRPAILGICSRRDHRLPEGAGASVSPVGAKLHRFSGLGGPGRRHRARHRGAAGACGTGCG